MKKLALLLPLITFNCFAVEKYQEKDYSIGLGIGSMYSGIGTNFAFVSEHDLKYISAGCIEYSSDSISACGFGAGWINTDLFDIDSNKHGFGIYATIVGEEHYTSYTTSDEGVTHYEHVNNVYGLGVSYTYFINGINRSGATIGLGIHATNADIDGKVGGILQVGYQF